MGSDSPRGRESDKWQCVHGSDDPSGCELCKAERQLKTGQDKKKDEEETRLLRQYTQKPDVAPRKGSLGPIETNNPVIASIKARLEGAAGRRPEAPVKRESAPAPKEDQSEEPVGRIVEGIDASALEGFVMDLLQQPASPGSLGEFARALQQADKQTEQRSAGPRIDPAKAAKMPNAMRLLMRLGKDGVPPGGEKHRDVSLLVTRAFMALSPESRMEIRKVLQKRRRLSPKGGAAGAKKVG